MIAFFGGCGGPSGDGTGRDEPARAPADPEGLASATTAFLGAPVADLDPLSILIFTRTEGYRHAAIPDAAAALTAVARSRGHRVEATADPRAFRGDALDGFDVIVFLLTTGDVLDDAEQRSLERFLRAGGGWVGVHSAADTEYDWPWYGDLLGAWFLSHPPGVQEADVRVLDPDHPSTAHLPDPWTRTDEWYDFRTDPGDRVDVLLRVDERSYSGGGMGEHHPVAWRHGFDGGRSFYTALGHTGESWADPAFLAHVWGGVEWAGGAPAQSAWGEDGPTENADSARGAGTRHGRAVDAGP